MFIDSHCHLASHRFDEAELPELIQNAMDAKVTQMVTLATCLDDIQANLSLANDPRIHCCIGIHPCDVHNAPDDAVEQLAAFTNDPRVCGIGETGLDYYHPAPDGWEEATYRQRQQDFLRQHFELAKKSGLNLVIHTRDQQGWQSYDDALAIYRDYHTSVRAVFHCFVGPEENAQKVIQLGGLVSFGGVATFKNAKDVQSVAANCPAGHFMLETDAPYLAPTPYRGKRNEPAHAGTIGNFIANLRKETVETLANHTSDTTNAFFRFRSSD